VNVLEHVSHWNSLVPGSFAESARDVVEVKRSGELRPTVDVEPLGSDAPLAMTSLDLDMRCAVSRVGRGIFRAVKWTSTMSSNCIVAAFRRCLCEAGSRAGENRVGERAGHAGFGVLRWPKPGHRVRPGSSPLQWGGPLEAHRLELPRECGVDFWGAPGEKHPLHQHELNHHLKASSIKGKQI
jgi:hypothetical protein